jgi:hypothetical protein
VFDEDLGLDLILLSLLTTRDRPFLHMVQLDNGLIRRAETLVVDVGHDAELLSVPASVGEVDDRGKAAEVLVEEAGL